MKENTENAENTVNIMNTVNPANNSVFEYFGNNPDAKLQDLFKFMYQSCFGCEHLVSDYDNALKWMLAEAKTAESDDLPDVEYLEGEYCRVHLKAVKGRENLEKLCGLFIKSSQHYVDGTDRLERELTELMQHVQSGDIALNADELAKETDEWRKEGFPAIHHSDYFRNAHHPAYRVIKKEYLDELNL